MRRVDSHSSIASDAPIRNAHTYGLSDANEIQYSYITAHASPIRFFTIKLVSSTYFSLTLIGIIVLNAILMTITTTEHLNIKYGWYIQITDFIFQAIYTFEIILKVFALQRIIITNLWHVFDIILVVLGFLEWVKYLGNVTIGNVNVVSFLQFFRVFRVICALRLLRTITLFRKLQLIVSSLLRSLPAMSALGFLLFLIMYISSVISRALYGTYWPLKFGSIGNAMLSCFQLLTLDDAFTFYDNIHTFDESISVFLFLYIVIATFVVCQMLIAIILNNLEEAQTQYNELIKDKFKRKKQLVNAIKEMPIDTMGLETSAPMNMNMNMSMNMNMNMSMNMNATTSSNTSGNSGQPGTGGSSGSGGGGGGGSTEPPSSAGTDKVPPISLINTIHSNIDSNINPTTSRGMITSRNPANDVHHSADPLHPSSKAATIAQKRVIDEYNRAFSQSTDREKQLTLQYFMGLASIENELNLYQNQMEVLNHLVHKLREQE